MPTTADDRPERDTETIETALGAVELERAGKGPPVLVVHGAPAGPTRRWRWAPSCARPSFETIAPSRPGYLGTAAAAQARAVALLRG